MNNPTTFKGLIYLKHGRLGTKSEGPDYYLQTWNKEYMVVYDDKRQPWLPDYYLEFFNRKIVELVGKIAGKNNGYEIIKVEKIVELKSTSIPRDRQVPVVKP